MEPAITLRILSHNRREFLEKTLASAFAQDEPFDAIELYDNGSDFPVKNLTEKYPSLRLAALPQPVTQPENFRRAFGDQPKTPWYCLFHDDDVLHPQFCRRTRAALKQWPELAAISCNGEVIDKLGKNHGPLLDGLKKNKWIKNPADLAVWYCESFVPFPPVVYRWRPSHCTDLDFGEDFGRVGDVALLGLVVSRGQILIRSEQDFSYRRHEGQDSAGFLWWEENKRWRLQMEMCKTTPAALRYVQKRRKERITSRWLNAWLKAEFLQEAWNWESFSLRAAHRFVRNNKRGIIRRLTQRLINP